jgi:DNA polymerase III subunit epsilon
MNVLDGPLVFVDIETNGLSHVRGRVIEVAAIRVEGGQIVREFKQLVDPGTPLPQFITNLTGITPEDLRDAPLFMAIADELEEVLAGAVFVAHNVRFDYSFLKQEFARIGKQFRPKQLCTVRLSRALFPAQRSHKLQELIRVHGLQVAARHRAYDDAHALWQFLQKLQSTMPAELLEQALARQLPHPSLPKGLSREVIDTLPAGCGVYIFEDESGQPIYIGKSIHIKERVMEHFMRDHAATSEFKIAQSVRRITTQETAGELEALLLESQLVKQHQPLYNKKLRRTEKLLLAKHAPGETGHLLVSLEEASHVLPEDIPGILAIYQHRGRARDALNRMAKEHDLCPKLLGLEKSKGACFSYQLHKCRGACVDAEPAQAYNERLLAAFARSRIEHWPFNGPILVQEKTDSQRSHGIIVDQWCVIGEIEQEPDCSPRLNTRPRVFDLDTYTIIRSHLTHKLSTLSVKPVSFQALRNQLGAI